MPQNSWRGDSQAIGQVTTLTVGGTPADTDTITAVMNRKEVTYILTALDTAITAAAALYALVSAANIVEFAEAQWTYTEGDDFITATATNPGQPFTLTASDTGTTTLTAATPTTSAGPNHYDDPDNWTLGAVPDATHDVLVAGGADLLYGSGTLAGNTIEVRGSFDGAGGLPEISAAGYYEYKTRYITFDSATVKIGQGDGAGSSRMLVKAVAGSTWTVYKTGQRESDGLPALDIDMTGNPTLISVAGGDVGFCVFNEGTARTVATVRMSGADSRLTLGRNVTVTAFDKDDGQADVYGTVTAVVNGSGDYNQEDGTLADILSFGGTCKMNHTGTVTSAVFRGAGAVCDCSANGLPRVFTASEFTGGAAIIDPNKTVTFTAPFLTDSASYAVSDIGPQFSVQRS